jgi:DNA-binding XRE family transcriptional regulator
MASTLPGEPSADPAGEAQALREEIERTREHLGDTVEQLAAKADVKKQARHALDKGARTAREQRGPLAAAVGALAAALAVLIIWKRGKRS